MAYTKTTWVNNQAPAINAENLNKIEDGIYNSVSVDAQVFTDEQRKQARDNINAAPGGFGYGENQAFANWDDNDGSKFDAFVDQMIDGTNKVVRLTGLADYPANIVSGNGGFADIKFYEDGAVIVLYYGPRNVLEGSNDAVFHVSKKRLSNGTWLPWEYDNPPLTIGVDYRTTEQYDGQPVYIKVVDCGVMANNKNVRIVSESYRVIDIILRGSPILFSMVPVDSILNGWQGGFYCDGVSITLYAGQNLVESNQNVTAIVKYIHT